MRIDKFLWCVRYYKTRNMVTEACKKNQVWVNGQLAKPAKEVFPGDEIAFRREQLTRTIKVLDLPSSRMSAKLVDIYRKDITPEEVYAQYELLQLGKDHSRRFGDGRPTKKDRRDFEDYFNEDSVSFEP